MYEQCVNRIRELLTEVNAKELVMENVLYSVNYDQQTNTSDTMKGVTRFVKLSIGKAIHRSIDVLAKDIEVLEGSVGRAQKHLDSFIGSEIGYAALIIIYMFYLVTLLGCACGTLILIGTVFYNQMYLAAIPLLVVLAVLAYNVRKS